MLCHLATCASASVLGARPARRAARRGRRTRLPSLGVRVVWIGGACEPTLNGAYRVVRCVPVRKVPGFRAESGQMRLVCSRVLVFALVRRLAATSRRCLVGLCFINLTSTIFPLPSPGSACTRQIRNNDGPLEHPLDPLVLRGASQECQCPHGELADHISRLDRDCDRHATELHHCRVAHFQLEGAPGCARELASTTPPCRAM